MITTFDGNVWYLQLYDCDSCLGLDNSGALKFDSDIEVEAGVFNTSNSRLWEKLRRNFPTQILAQWEYLRLNEFTEENIMKYLVDNISDKIPEINYNKDAWKKYISLGTDYLFACHGNRRQQISRWIKERLIYVDTLLGYTVSTNDYLTIRANKLGEVYFDIQTFQPMYFSIKFRNEENGTGTITKRISRGETVRFSYTLPVATDQEILVYGGRFIKDLGDLTNLNPTNLLLENATRLTRVKCNNSDMLINASIGSCTMLQEVDLRGCSNLGAGSDASLQTLDLSNCRNLRFVDIYGTQLTALYTSQVGGIIQEIIYPYSIQIVQVANQSNLTSLGIPCYYTGNYNDPDNIFAERLTEISVSDCPNVVSFVKNYCTDEYGQEITVPTFIGVSKGRSFNLKNVMSYLTKIDLSYCSNIESMTLDNFNNLTEINLDDIALWNSTNSNLYNLTLTNCPNVETLTFNQNTLKGENSLGVAFKEGTTLDLSGLYNLKHIYSNIGIKGLKKLILPLSVESLIFDYPQDTTYSQTDSDIECIFSKNVNHDSDNFKGIDLKDINTITDFSMGSLTKINNAINLNIKITNTYPYFNYFKTEDYFKPQGTIDISEYNGKLEYLFKGIDLDKLKIICNEPLPHESGKYMFAFASGQNVANLNSLFDFMPSMTDFSYMFYNGNLKNAPTIPLRATNTSYMFYNNTTMETTPANWLRQYYVTPVSDYCYTGCASIHTIDETYGTLDEIPSTWGGFDRINVVFSGESIVAEKTLKREFPQFIASGQTLQNIVPEVGQTPILIANRSEQLVGDGKPNNVIITDGTMTQAELVGLTLVNLASEKRSTTFTCNQSENNIREGILDACKIANGEPIPQLEMNGQSYVNIMTDDDGRTDIIRNNKSEFFINDGIDENILISNGKMLSTKLYGETWINIHKNEMPTLTNNNKQTINVKDVLEETINKEFLLENNNFKQAILKGCTITNLQPSTTYTHQNGSNINFVDTITAKSIIGQKYFIKIFNTNLISQVKYGNDKVDVVNNYAIATATSTGTVAKTLYFYTINIDDDCTGVQFIICKYEDGMENWDIDYFEGTQSTKPTSIATNKSTLSCGEEITLRSNGNVYDELDLLTGQVIQRIGEDNEILEEEIVRTVELDGEINFYENGYIYTNSNEITPKFEFQPTLTNYYIVSDLKPNTQYTVLFEGNPTIMSLGGTTIENPISKIMITSGEADNILWFDIPVSKIMLLEGDLTNRNVEYFTGVKSSQKIEVQLQSNMPDFAKGGRK